MEDGVVPSRMVGVSASVNLPLRHKVHKFSYGTGSPGWSQKKGHKTVVVMVGSCLWMLIFVESDAFAHTCLELLVNVYGKLCFDTALYDIDAIYILFA